MLTEKWKILFDPCATHVASVLIPKHTVGVYSLISRKRATKFLKLNIFTKGNNFVKNRLAC